MSRKHEIAQISRCRMCDEKFTGPPLVLVVGETAPARLARYIDTLTRHIAERHADVFTRAQVTAAELQGVLILGCYKTEDPQVNEQRDYLRWSVHQQTRAIEVSDARIEERAKLLVESFAVDHGVPIRQGETYHDAGEALKLRIRNLLVEMRDTITEKGRYVPAQAGADGKPAMAAN